MYHFHTQQSQSTPNILDKNCLQSIPSNTADPFHKRCRCQLSWDRIKYRVPDVEDEEATLPFQALLKKLTKAERIQLIAKLREI